MSTILHDRITQRRQTEFGSDIQDIIANELAKRVAEIGNTPAATEFVQSPWFDSAGAKLSTIALRYALAGVAGWPTLSSDTSAPARAENVPQQDDKW